MVATRHSLLLVEDSSEDEELSLAAIARCGIPCEVSVIRHGGEVVGALHSPEAGVPDLIVLDFHLPGLNGLEILRELRGHLKTRLVPIVILSALGSDEEITRCLHEGANSCVQKPFDSGVYLEHVALVVRYWLTVDKRPELRALHSLGSTAENT